MQLATGDQVVIQNSERPQGTPQNPPRFVIHEVAEYKGQYIVHASKLPHQQHVYILGIETIPEKAACFVILPHETEQGVVSLVLELRGIPLYLEKGRDRLWILNWRSTMPPFSSGPTNNKDLLMDRARKAIDLYHDWKDADYEMPIGFIIDRNKAEK